MTAHAGIGPSPCASEVAPPVYPSPALSLPLQPFSKLGPWNRSKGRRRRRRERISNLIHLSLQRSLRRQNTSEVESTLLAAVTWRTSSIRIYKMGACLCCVV